MERDFLITRMEQGDCLMHYGVKGMKWGVRRYKNPDGTLTPAGKRRMARRERDISKFDKEASDYRQRVKDDRQMIADIEKNGKNGEGWKNFIAQMYMGKRENWPNDDSYDKEFKKTSDDLTTTEAIYTLKDDIDSSLMNARQSEALSKNTRNAPINQRTYTESVRRGKAKAIAFFAGSSLAAVGVAALARKTGLTRGGGRISKGELAVDTIIASGVFGAIAATTYAAYKLKARDVHSQY